LLVNVDVHDLPKRIAFYQQTIGLQVGRQFGSFGALSAVYLLLKPDRARRSAEADDLRRYRRHWTPIRLDLVVPDSGAAVARAIDVGATMKGKIRTHNWGRIAQLADPLEQGRQAR
jgi:predicted enzyme related to lactoylglutathione lyase